MKQGYLELIGAMSERDSPLFVFGGVAEDALLDRRLSRPHADVDVLVTRDELDQRIRQCDALGFRDFEVNYEAIRGRPLALGVQRRLKSALLAGHTEVMLRPRIQKLGPPEVSKDLPQVVPSAHNAA